LHCRVDVADTVATSVGLSPDATREALANLVDNARRHARNTVTLQVRVADGQLRLAVQDDGPGLGPDMVDTAFTRMTSSPGTPLRRPNSSARSRCRRQPPNLVLESESNVQECASAAST
jgi:signal transduction histidine kinase